MEASQIFIIVAIGVLAVLALVVFILNKDKKRTKMTPLVSFALVFIVVGIFFSDSQWLSYSAFGIAIVISVIDMIIKLKNKK